MNAVIVLSSVLNLVASALLSLVVFTATGKGDVRRQFLLFLVCITTWALFYFFWQIADTREVAYWSCVGLIVPATFIPVTFYHLSLKLSDAKKEPFHLWLGYGVGVLATATAAFGGLVSGVSPKMEFPYWPDAGPFLYLVVALFLIYVPLSASTLIRGSNLYIGVRSSQMRFVLGSSAIGFVGGFTNFPLWYNIQIPPYGNLIVFIYLLMVGYGVYNRRISGIYVDIFKAVIYLLLAASFSMFYVLGRVIFGIVVEGDVVHTSYWVEGVIAFFLSSLLFWGIPKLRSWTEYMLELTFRRDQLTTVAQLESIPSRLSSLTDEEQIFRETCDSLTDILGISGAAVLTREHFDSQYQTRYSCGEISTVSETLEFELDDPLVAQLVRKPECIVLDQLYGEMSIELEARLVELKRDVGLAVVVPVAAGNDLQGLLLLGSSTTSKLGTPEHVSLLFAVGSQIGLDLRARDLERRSNEVDKLVALGTMAAGLSHEIRNPLVSIQTFASLIKSGKDIEKMPEDFRSVLVRDVKRIESIVDGVAAYSKNQKGTKSVNDIAMIVQSSLDIYQPQVEGSGTKLELSASTDQELLVFSNYDQLVQVFNNLIENAIHALNGRSDGVILIQLNARSAQSPGRSRWVEVSVTDNGEGVPETIIDRIFDPFTTSKDTGSRDDKQGMGLGLAISKRIIENHDGAITVTNIPGAGAKFVVSLRLFDSK